MTVLIGRREFVTLLGGAAVSWPLAARAQKARKIHSIGLLNAGSALASVNVAFFETLRQLGWIEGENVVFNHRYAENSSNGWPSSLRGDRIRTFYFGS